MPDRIVKSFYAFLIIAIASFSVSCSNTRRAVYFNDQKEAVIPAGIPVPEAVIQNNDLLNITVSSLSPEASTIFNIANFSYSGSRSDGQPEMQVSGYLVNKEGYIQFPILGSIKAAGLTESQLKTQIESSLTEKKLLVNPIVSIRHLNFKVTVLGEVARPMVINVPNEKITLLEALGLAGDITVFGKKDNVMVIREQAGIKTIKRLNLNSSEIFNSSYYYLMSNDVVYVEANKAKISSSSRTNALLPVIFSGLSFAVIVVDRLIR
jgi:polysaccharide export outer membrane protein